jgi:hypothetical protein
MMDSRFVGILVIATTGVRLWATIGRKEGVLPGLGAFSFLFGLDIEEVDVEVGDGKVPVPTATPIPLIWNGNSVSFSFFQMAQIRKYVMCNVPQDFDLPLH